MVRTLSAALLACLGCNQVFGLDEVSIPARSARFDEQFLTAGAATTAPRAVQAAAYLVADSGAAGGYRLLPTTVDGDAVVTSEDPGGEYVLRVTLPDSPIPLHLVSAAEALHLTAVTLGRADLEPAQVGATLAFDLAIATPWTSADTIALFTFGVWARSELPVVTVMDDRITFPVAWDRDELIHPGNAPFGRLRRDDLVVVGRYADVAGIRTLVEVFDTSVDQEPSTTTTTAIVGALGPITTQPFTTTAADLPLRASQVPGFETVSWTTAWEARVAPHTDLGNNVGLRLAAGPLTGAQSHTIGRVDGLSGWTELAVTSITGVRSIGSSKVGVAATQVRPLANDGAGAIDAPFMRGFTVAGVELVARATPTMITTAGALELTWTPEPGVAAPDLYSVAILNVTTDPPVPVFQGLTAATRIAVPGGVVPIGTPCVVAVTAVRGYPGFAAGDLTSRSYPRTEVTTPSLPFVLQ